MHKPISAEVGVEVELKEASTGFQVEFVPEKPVCRKFVALCLALVSLDLRRQPKTLLGSKEFDSLGCLK